MKTAGFKAAIVLFVASVILVGVAFAGWGGGYRHGAWGPGPGSQPGTPAEPQGQTPWMGQGPSPGLEPGTPTDPQGQAPWMGWGHGPGAPGLQFRRPGPARGDGPWANVPPARYGRGNNYAFCPYCGAPLPSGGWGTGFGCGRGPTPRFENRDGGPGPGFQGRAWGPWGQGFGRRDGMRQPGPMANNWSRGPRQGRGGEGFPPQDRTPQDRGRRPGWRQGGAGGRSRPESLTPPGPPLDENENNFWAPPRWQRWGPGRGRGVRPGDDQNIGVPAGPEVTAPPEGPADEPAKTPEANVPAPENPQP
jgi:hypothetical protein